jgi:hypothetical protein
MSLTDSLNLIARMEGYNPDVKDLPAKQQVKNAKGSGDDVPVFGETWIKYWKIFTKKEIPSVCPLCGNAITEKETEGCHILIKSHPSNGTCDGNGSYEKKEYIIPGHHKCNCQFDEEFELEKDITAVEALKK